MLRLSTASDRTSPRQAVSKLAPPMWRAKEAFSDSVYRESRLPVRVFEAARMRVAHANGCALCIAYRTPRDRPRAGRDEELPEAFYEAVTDWRTASEFSERERLAIEFAERFALDHLSLDDDEEFWSALHQHFSESEVVDLGVSVAAFVAGGRLAHVLGLDACEIPARHPGSISG